MIKTVAEIGNSLQYRNTPETYQELIDRQTKIIYKWHENHGKLSRKLKKAEKAILEFFNTDAPQNEFTDLTECYEVLGKLKEILVVNKV